MRFRLVEILRKFVPQDTLRLPPGAAAKQPINESQVRDRLADRTPAARERHLQVAHLPEHRAELAGLYRKQGQRQARGARGGAGERMCVGAVSLAVSLCRALCPKLCNCEMTEGGPTVGPPPRWSCRLLSPPPAAPG